MRPVLAPAHPAPAGRSELTETAHFRLTEMLLREILHRLFLPAWFLSQQAFGWQVFEAAAFVQQGFRTGRAARYEPQRADPPPAEARNPATLL